MNVLDTAISFLDNISKLIIGSPSHVEDEYDHDGYESVKNITSRYSLHLANIPRSGIKLVRAV